MGNSKNDGKIGVSLGADLLARCDTAIEKQTHEKSTVSDRAYRGIWKQAWNG